MSTEEESETKKHVQDTLRIRQLQSHLSDLRKDVYLTEISQGLPRLKIEFHGSFEEARLPWALISPQEDDFILHAWAGWTSFREETFINAEELSEILSSLQESSPCPGLSEYFLLENVDRLQIADFFLFYSEPSQCSSRSSFPTYRSRQCTRYLISEEEDGARCGPCGELFRRIRSPREEEDFKSEEEEDYFFEEDAELSSSGSTSPPPPLKTTRKKNWECKHCGGSFKNRASLRSHECNEISGEGDFQHSCSECTREFRYGGTYVEHLFHVHRVDPSHAEILVNERLQIKCPSCEDEFGDPVALERHRGSVHLYKDAIVLEEHSHFECYDCGKLFSCHRSFLRHRRRSHHSFTGRRKSSSSSSVLINKRCYFCPRHFTRRGRLARHLREAHAEKDLSSLEEVQAHTPKELRVCDICGKAVRNMSNHKENAHNSGDVLMPCHICGKSVKKISFRGHLTTHQVKSWLCSDCGQGFAQKTYLERHARIHDPDYKCLPCKFCNKRFGRSDCLKKHLKSAHLGQKDYICSTCGKAFVCKSKLNRHNVVHQNVKNYPCEACNYQCSRLDNLNAHRSKVHGLGKTTTAAVKERSQTTTQQEDDAIGGPITTT